MWRRGSREFAAFYIIFEKGQRESPVKPEEAVQLSS